MSSPSSPRSRVRGLSGAHFFTLTRSSAIAKHQIEERGYRTLVHADELVELGFSRTVAEEAVPGLLIPMRNVLGHIDYAFRPDDPGDGGKYLRPYGAGNFLDVPERVRPLLGDPSLTLFITEGQKKVDAAVSKGLACIGLLGVWGWRAKNARGGSRLIPDFEHVALNDRRVVLAFDRDVTTKRQVRQALKRLSKVLTARGAKVEILLLPALAGVDKVGLDDFFAAGHSAEDLEEHLLPELPDAEMETTPADLAAQERVGSFFDASERFLPRALGEHLIADHDLHRHEDGGLTRYAGDGLHLPAEAILRAEMTNLLHDEWSGNRAEDALRYAQAAAPVWPRPWDTPPAVEDPLWLGNGVLEGVWAGRPRLRPHTAEDCAPYVIPTPWEPEALCPRFDAFLEESLSRDAARIVPALIGLSLYPGNPLHLAVLLVGPGRNGKSVLLKVWEAIAGVQNTAHVSLHRLSHDRFAKGELLGKLLNVCDDLDTSELGRTDALKILTTGARCVVERKYRNAIEAQLTAFPVFASNELPRTLDLSAGWFERWVLLPMERVPTKADPWLPETLAKEAPGILYKALRAARGVLRKGKLPASAERRDTQHEFRLEVDSIYSFAEEKLASTPGESTPRAVVYQSYRHFVVSQGGQPKSAARFYAKIRALFLEGGKQRFSAEFAHENPFVKVRGIRVLKNVGLKLPPAPKPAP